MFTSWKTQGPAEESTEEGIFQIKGDRQLKGRGVLSITGRAESASKKEKGGVAGTPAMEEEELDREGGRVFTKILVIRVQAGPPRRKGAAWEMGWAIFLGGKRKRSL